MRIAVLNSGVTYVGWSDFLTCDEWSEHVKWLFDHSKGDPDMQNVPARRAKALGATCKKQSCFECGPGFLFGNDTPESLEERVKKLYPQLI